jgi:hypothetical protein
MFCLKNPSHKTLSTALFMRKLKPIELVQIKLTQQERVFGGIKSGNRKQKNRRFNHRGRTRGVGSRHRWLPGMVGTKDWEFSRKQTWTGYSTQETALVANAGDYGGG